MSSFLSNLAVLVPLATVRGHAVSIADKVGPVPTGLEDQLASVVVLANLVGDIWSHLFNPLASNHVYGLSWDSVGPKITNDSRTHMQNRSVDCLLGPIIRALSLRIVILESLAAVVHFSSSEIDVLRVAWGCVAAFQAVDELALLATSLDDTGALSALAGFDLHTSLPCQQVSALARIFWGQFARVSLLFEASLEPSQPIEAEEGPSAPAVDHPAPSRAASRESTGFFSTLFKKIRPSMASMSDLTAAAADAELRRDSLGGSSLKPAISFPLLNSSGSTELATSIRNVISHCDYPSTFFIASNSRSRPGKRCWHQQFNVFTRDDDDPSTKGGMASWCMCTMLPSWAGHKAAGGHLTRIGFNLASIDDDDSRQAGAFISFRNERTVYYIQRSPLDVDGGRLYFGLIVDAVPPNETRMPQSEMLERSAKVAESEKASAMRGLRAVLEAWIMSGAVSTARKVSDKN